MVDDVMVTIRIVVDKVTELAGHVSSWASASCGLASVPVSVRKVDNVMVATMFMDLVDKITFSKRLRASVNLLVM